MIILFRKKIFFQLTVIHAPYIDKYVTIYHLSCFSCPLPSPNSMREEKRLCYHYTQRMRNYLHFWKESWLVYELSEDRYAEKYVERLQSHMILTMSHWSSGLTCLLPATRVTGSNPVRGTCVKPGELSRYIGDPDVIDHQQGFVPPTVTRPSYQQCDSPT